MSEERRACAVAELRVIRAEGKAPKIRGYAAVFYKPGDPGTEFRIFSDLVERVAPTAFDQTLREDDIRALVNHDSAHVLGRKSAGTLSLGVDARGLFYEATPPDTQAARDLMVSIERGDVSGSSFGFRPVKTSYTRGQNGEPDIATLEQVRLLEVSPVTFPAYGGTSAGLRAAEPADEYRKGYEAWKAEQEAVAVRLRLLEIGA